MRQARIKVSAADGDAIYHCGSKSVNGEWLFDDVAKEVFKRQLWQVADYCGVQIVTYALLSNHFHILLRIPQLRPVSDQELLRRYAVLYPTPNRFQAARIAVIKAELDTNGPEAVNWRQRQLSLMGDLSQFMKLLKQRFSIWYNNKNRRFGPLWSDRFKSVLVERKTKAIQPIAAYIDLNCVRAGIVNDPIEYRFCGYAEAVAGNRFAREGINFIIGAPDWHEAQAQYRELIFGTGAKPREGAASIAQSDLERVTAERGAVSLAAALRCQIRYFSEGLVLGSRVFVETQFNRFRKSTHPHSRCRPQPISDMPAGHDLVAMRRLRRRVVNDGIALK